MRYGIVLAAALTVAPLTAMSATSAHAADWCGFSARPNAIVQCGYSSLEGCENTIGKGAMCFVNPYVAINEKRNAPVDGVTATARKG
jgi:Protein of unknown function (DUF3551)